MPGANAIATFSLQARHQAEHDASIRTQARINAETITASNNPPPKNAAGDHRYRIPTIGLNAGAMPGTSPHIVVTTT